MSIVTKSEWHQVERRFVLELDESLVAEVYPDMDEDEVTERYNEIINEEYLIENFEIDAMESSVDLPWEWIEDDWWTDRKGGYDVTYNIEEE